MSADNMGHIAESLHSGETVFFEMLLSTKNRDRIPVDISARIFELNHEKVVLTVARDITKQKQIEQKLIEKQAADKSASKAGEGKGAAYIQ